MRQQSSTFKHITSDLFRLLGCLTLLIFLAPAPDSAAVEVVIPNGDFEAGLPGTGPPSSWTIQQGNMYVTTGAGLANVDPSSAFSGSQFLTASRWAPNPNDSFPSNQRMSIFQEVDLSSHETVIDQGGKTVELSFAYNDGDGGDNGVVTMQFLDQSDSLIGVGEIFHSDSAPTASGAWATKSIYASAPVGARSMLLSISGERAGTSGTVRNISFDAFSAQLLDNAPFEAPSDRVHGNLIMFNHNGAWSWYQDERAIVDAEGGRLITGGVGNSRGWGGEAENSDVKATIFDFSTGERDTTLLHDRLFSHSGGDDHNTAAFLKLPNGNILSMYSGHNTLNGSPTYSSFYRILDAQTETWGPEGEFDWDDPGHGGANFTTTYSNLFYLPNEGTGEGRILNIARSHDRSPNFMYSDDLGETWEYGGQLTTTSNVGYVNGYFKHAATGEDRIDFIATEHHPRDFNTSLYHGYIQDGKMYDSDGVELDDNIYNRQNPPSPDDFTPVFLSNTVVDGQIMTRVWNTDLQTYDDGTITALFKARAAPYNNDPNVDKEDHRVFYGRFDGASWTYTELGKAGANLYNSEQDYTGLGALHPADPNTVYISTEFHPGTDAPLGVHEIFKGVTSDHGQSWTWTAITENSTHDNLRPLIPEWDDENTALIWFRGDYLSQGYFDAAVVGIIDRKHEHTGLVEYIDANATNTMFANGDALQTAPTPTNDGLWHLRTGYGNDGNVLSSNELLSEDAAMLKTSVDGLEEGTYDVFAFFWSDNDQDWMLQAGFADDDLLPFRIRGSQHAEADQFTSIDIVSDNNGDLLLYRAYVGRRTVSSDGSISVFIDDWPNFDFSGQTWYDGIGLAKVTAVPEPSVLGMLLLTLPGLTGITRFRSP